MPYANNKGADQPAHPRSLSSAFNFHFLDSIIHILVKSKMLRPYLVSEAEQAGLSLTWSQTKKTCFLMTRLICPKIQDHYDNPYIIIGYRQFLVHCLPTYSENSLFFVLVISCSAIILHR